MENQNELTYSAAVKELEEIVQLMQSPDCSVDNLGKYTKRSAELLKICKAKLTSNNSTNPQNSPHYFCASSIKIGFHGLNEVENKALIFLNQKGL